MPKKNIGGKDWEKINSENAVRLRDGTSVEQRRKLRDLGGKISLIRQQGLPVGSHLLSAGGNSTVPKRFLTPYWAELAYKMSQKKYGGLYTAEELREMEESIRRRDYEKKSLYQERMKYSQLEFPFFS